MALTIEDIKPFIDEKAIRKSGVVDSDKELALVLQTAVTCANSLEENMLSRVKIMQVVFEGEGREQIGLQQRGGQGVKLAGALDSQEAKLSQNDLTLIVWGSSFSSFTGKSNKPLPASFELARVISSEDDGRLIVGSLVPLFDLTFDGNVTLPTVVEKGFPREIYPDMKVLLPLSQNRGE